MCAKLDFSPAAAVVAQVTAQCLPLQVNRIKIPKQLEELVEMQNESSNPVLKVFSKIRAEFRGVRHRSGCIGVVFYARLNLKQQVASLVPTDLVNF